MIRSLPLWSVIRSSRVHQHQFQYRASTRQLSQRFLHPCCCTTTSTANSSQTNQYIPANRNRKLSSRSLRGDHHLKSERNRATTLGSRKPKSIDKQIVEEINMMQETLNKMSPLPPIWKSQLDLTYTENGTKQRKKVLAQVRQCIHNVHHAIMKGQMSRSSHLHELSSICERLLMICSETNQSTAAFRESEKLFNRMESWNLNRVSNHYYYAMKIAARANRWEEASELFWSSVDPTTRCLPIVDPVGFYVIIKHNQERQQDGAFIVDQVMKAVQNMTMVLPHDYNNILLAASTALGYGKEWQPFIKYLDERNNFDQTIVASAMNACLLCGQKEEALHFFTKYEKQQSLKTEDNWLWASGKKESLFYLLRDLIMRASAVGENESDRAVSLYWEAIEDGVTISLEAVCGVLEACKKDKKWNDAMSVFFSILTRTSKTDTCWMVHGNEVSIGPIDSSMTSRSDLIPCMGKLVSIIMQICNSKNEFATSLLVFLLLESALLPSRNWTGKDNFVDSFLPLMETLSEDRDSVLNATMASLEGLSLVNESIMLYETIVTDTKKADFESSTQLYQIIQLNRTSIPTSHWALILDNMHFFILAVRDFADHDEAMPTEELKHLSAVHSSIVTVCTNAMQPTAGLMIDYWVNLHANTDRTYLPVTDALLASLIKAHTLSGDPEVGLEVFAKHKPKSASVTWLLSSIEAIRAFFQVGQKEAALSLFVQVVQKRYSHDLMSVVAGGLYELGDHEAVSEVYRLALAKGCVSEQLGMLAMKNAAASPPDIRISSMPSISRDLALIKDSSASDYVKSNYWAFKRMLEVKDICRLLNWRRLENFSLFELNLSLSKLHFGIKEKLVPKDETLICIIEGANSRKAFTFREDETRLFPWIPRNDTDWISTLRTVASESHYSSLLQNNKLFLLLIAEAFKGLGESERGTQILDDAFARGIDIETSDFEKH